MKQSPNFRPYIALLLAFGAILPIALCLVLGVGALLTAMGDTGGGWVLNRIGLALGILWLFDLIVLVLFQGLHSVVNSTKNRDDTDES